MLVAMLVLVLVLVLVLLLPSDSGEVGGVDDAEEDDVPISIGDRDGESGLDAGDTTPVFQYRVHCSSVSSVVG
jgi:hypothetical protein